MVLETEVSRKFNNDILRLDKTPKAIVMRFNLKTQTLDRAVIVDDPIRSLWGREIEFSKQD